MRLSAVRVSAFFLVLTGCAEESPKLGGTTFVGAGLVFAGVSDWCGMARLLALMPWNRRARSAAAA
jgi:Protein of unknown function (DUF2892)